jgi:hypothetical protein
MYMYTYMHMHTYIFMYGESMHAGTGVVGCRSVLLALGSVPLVERCVRITNGSMWNRFLPIFRKTDPEVLIYDDLAAVTSFTG